MAPGAITYVHGDATAPIGAGSKILVHVCNDIGGWGAGFVVAISKRWKKPEKEYRAWYRGDADQPFELGEVQLVEVEASLRVANLIGQHGIKAKTGAPPIRYDAVRKGLASVREHALALGASVHMPRIGCGLAGGTWEEILPIVESELSAAGVDVTVYDYP